MKALLEQPLTKIDEEIVARFQALELGNGEALLLQTATGDYYGMNETASLIWGTLERHLAPHEIGGELATRFDLSLFEARERIDRLTEDLRTKLLATEEDAE